MLEKIPPWEKSVRKTFPTFTFFVLFSLQLNTALGTDVGDVEQLVLGTHVLTLQWLQSQKGIGKARIYKKDGEIFIDGYQEENYEGHLNYLSIKGKIKIINPKELEFDGTIVTQINYINSGVLRERKGKFLLKVWGTRKYWRMQNMTQPDNQFTVTDHIDIYFEKYR